jgi:hypothetical protein
MAKRLVFAAALVAMSAASAAAQQLYPVTRADACTSEYRIGLMEAECGHLTMAQLRGYFADPKLLDCSRLEQKIAELKVQKICASPQRPEATAPIYRQEQQLPAPDQRADAGDTPEPLDPTLAAAPPPPPPAFRPPPPRMAPVGRPAPRSGPPLVPQQFLGAVAQVFGKAGYGQQRPHYKKKYYRRGYHASAGAVSGGVVNRPGPPVTITVETIPEELKPQAYRCDASGNPAPEGGTGWCRQRAQVAPTYVPRRQRPLIRKY